MFQAQQVPHVPRTAPVIVSQPVQAPAAAAAPALVKTAAPAIAAAPAPAPVTQSQYHAQGGNSIAFKKRRQMVWGPIQ